MSILTQFYFWLTPEIPFDFIKNHSAVECATLLGVRAGQEEGPHYQRVTVEITPVPDGDYSFCVQPRSLAAYFIVQARGTISPVSDDYAKIEGMAHTKPTKIGIAYFAVGLALTLSIVIGIVITLFAHDSPLVALIGVIALTGFIAIFATLHVQFQRWSMATYTDRVLGILVRSL
jgi:hypothetical protein